MGCSVLGLSKGNVDQIAVPFWSVSDGWRYLLSQRCDLQNEQKKIKIMREVVMQKLVTCSLLIMVGTYSERALGTNLGSPKACLFEYAHFIASVNK